MEWNSKHTAINATTTTTTAGTTDSSGNQRHDGALSIVVSMATVMKIADEMVRQHQHLLVAQQLQQQQQQQQLLVSPSNATTTNTTTATATTGLRNCCITLIKLLDNLLKYPINDNTTGGGNTTTMCHKVRRINLLNPNIQQSIVQYPLSSSRTTTTMMTMNHQQQLPNHRSLGISFLLACGFLKGSDIATTTTATCSSSSSSIGDAMIDQNTLVLLPSNENTQHIIKAKQVLVNICIYELHIPINEIPGVQHQQQQQQQQQQPLQQNTNINHNTNNNNNSSSGVQQPTVLPGGFNPYQGSRIDVTGQQPPTFTTTGSSNSKIDLELQQLQNAQQKLLAEQQQQSTKNGNGKTNMDREWTMSILSSSDNSIPTTTTTTTNTTAGAVNTSTSSYKGDGALLAQHIQQQSLERQKRENSGFTTKAMRDIERLKKSRIYTHVTLSIHMKLSLLPTTKSNSTNNSTNNNNLPATVDIQLIGKFLPNETISDVMNAIHSDCFEENNVHHHQIHFELYSTPPMVVYNNIHQTLLQEQLVPASKLFLRWTASTSTNDTKATKPTKIKASSKSVSSQQSQPPPTIDILQLKWLSMIIPSLSSTPVANTATTIAFPKSIPILSALQSTTTTNDNDDGEGGKKPAAIPPKKESKEDRLLRRMMGGGGGGGAR